MDIKCPYCERTTPCDIDESKYSITHLTYCEHCGQMYGVDGSRNQLRILKTTESYRIKRNVEQKFKFGGFINNPE